MNIMMGHSSKLLNIEVKLILPVFTWGPARMIQQEYQDLLERAFKRSVVNPLDGESSIERVQGLKYF